MGCGGGVAVVDVIGRGEGVPVNGVEVSVKGGFELRLEFGPPPP